MKFTLINYQEEAVADILKRLKKARKDWREEGERSAFSLTAATGAGKTVMAAAALEALFKSDDKFDFDRDKGAVVIWFSDDPSLNEQTRYRLRGLADFAETHGHVFRRIEAVDEIDGSLKVLDLQDASVRDVIRGVESAKLAYLGESAGSYSSDG